MKRRSQSILAWGAIVAASLSSCVLVDPPPTLPAVPELPPIVQSSNPPGPVLTTWPTEGFAITVYVSDDTAPIYTVAFEDYSDAKGVNEILPRGSAVEWPAPPGNTSETRTIVIRDLSPPMGPGCHTLEIILANSFSGAQPNPPGGTVLSWLYVGSGSPLDCMSNYDAGAAADGAFPPADAGPSDGSRG
jgi:hypothetical protein